ncbi:restriction endonuclease subunit S [Mesobacillus jeotgali]|uniref:restriction endonuclease subunit S n=1 Tax=Mesobacillus jeotgali TaxID=129985 RepID=UPI001CFE19BD|nr:restriction endonuclease subunit S [Mesobacillus jeotgali]
MTTIITRTYSDLFNIIYGNRELTDKSTLTPGDTIVISSQGTENGCYGFFDYETVYKAPFITVPRTGSIGEAFVQQYDCAVTDDCLLLFPKEPMSIEQLYVHAAAIRQQKWRFNYGRKITPTRLNELELLNVEINDKAIKAILRDVLNHKDDISAAVFQYFNDLHDSFIDTNHEEVPITRLFHVNNGKSIGLDNYPEGEVPYISSGETNNGLVGFVDPLEDGEVFPAGSITVSAFCKAHVQMTPFIARGNGGSSVKVLVPKIPMDLKELLWYALEVNKQQWRYSYGKMVSKTRLQEFILRKPTF